jgi:integrase
MLVLPRETYLRLAAHVGVKSEVIATWPELLTSYQDYLDKRLAIHDISENSVINYKGHLRKFDSFLSERDKPVLLLRDITTAVVDEYRFTRIARIQAKKGERGGVGYIQESSTLHGAFEYAVRNKLALCNPFSCLKNRGSEDRGSPPFEPGELLRIREHAEEDWLVFIVFRWTGLRESDVATLAWKEVRFDRGEIIKPTKKSHYAQSAVIPMDKELVDVLKKELDRRKPHPDELVLQHKKPGKPLCLSHVVGRANKLIERAGIAGSPHQFRDTFAVDMFLCKKQPELYVARMLGDTVETVRKHYLPYVQAMRDDAKRLTENGTRLEDLAGTHASQ